MVGVLAAEKHSVLAEIHSLAAIDQSVFVVAGELKSFPETAVGIAESCRHGGFETTILFLLAIQTWNSVAPALPCFGDSLQTPEKGL